MRIVDVRQRTPEWHVWRNRGVSASEADVVMGLSDKKTPWRLWAEKKGLVLPEDLSGNPHVQRGIRHEAAARRAFEARHDELLLPVCGESLEHAFIRASFDGITDLGIPVEIKCPTEDNFREAVAAGTESVLYRRYYAQVQQQILVSGADRGWLTLFFEGNCHDFSVPRDDAFIQELVSKAEGFWHLLQSGQEPPKDPARDIYVPTGQELADWLALAAEYRRISTSIESRKAHIRSLEQQRDDLEQRLVSAMGDFTQGEAGGVRVNRFLQQGPIDYKAALATMLPDPGEDAIEKFRRKSSERVRVTLKDEEKATVPFSLAEPEDAFIDDWCANFNL